MSRFLMIDIGAGTMDLLCYDDRDGGHSKAVAVSPVRQMADAVRRLDGPIVFTGGEMGGGAVTAAIAEKAARGEVLMTPDAAETVHHNPDRVRQMGINIIPEAQVAESAGRKEATLLELGDIQHRRLRDLVAGLGEKWAFDVVAICAQDHGRPPAGVSHLDFRHQLHRQRLDRSPRPEACLYRADEVPPAFNRLGTIAAEAAQLPAERVYVMDSGMAAILGASLDPVVENDPVRMVLDVATSHTVAAVLEQDDIAAFFEYHTHDVTRESLERLLPELAGGRLAHERVLAEGGHGAYLRRTVGFDRVKRIVATGPQRLRLLGSRMPVVWGAPLGDNMMTGTVGLLEAVRRREGRPPRSYI